MGILDKYKKQKQNKDTNTKQVKSTPSGILGKYKVQKIGESFNSWLEQNESFVDSYSNRFYDESGKYISDKYRGDTLSELENAQKIKNELEIQRQEILSGLKDYSSAFDSDWLKKAQTSLNDAGGAYEKIIKTYSEDNELFSGFKNADEFYDWSEKKKQKETLRNTNLDSVKTEISDLTNALNNILSIEGQKSLLANQYDNLMYSSNQYPSAEGQTELNAIKAELDAFDKKQKELEGVFSSSSDIKKKLEELNETYSSAKELQETEALTTDALNASDFEKFAQKGSEWGNDTNFEFYGKDEGRGTYGFFNREKNDLISYYRNNLSSYEDEAKHMVNGPTKEMEKAYHFAKEMTEDEYNIYAYYLGKGDTDSAQKYLDSIEQSITYRFAEDFYDKNLKDANYLEQIVFALTAGTEQFQTGLENLFLDSSEFAPSYRQVASEKVREDLKDKSFNFWYNFKTGEWEDKINGNSIGQIGYDLASTTGNMLPSILTSAAVSYINPVAGQMVGSALMGASAKGNAYAEMINLGYNPEQASRYSTLVGASEAGLQFLLGGIGKLGGSVSRKAISSAVSKIDNVFARTAIQLGGNILSEGTEEYLQEVLDPFFKNIAFGEDNDIRFISEDALYSGLLGALSAGVLEGGSTVGGNVSTYRTGKQLKAAGVTAKQLSKLGSKLSINSEAYKLAGRINENTGAYTIGRMFNALNAEITAQNKAEIKEALRAKGINPISANSIANWMERVVAGEELTAKQKAALENNPVLGEVMRDVLYERNTTALQRQAGLDSIRSQLEEYQIKQALDKAVKKAEKKKAKNTANNTADTQDTQNTAQQAEAEDFEAETDTSLAESEKANEANPRVSDNGRTFSTKTGEDLDIVGIASVKDKTFKTVDGQTVDSKDVSFATENEAVLYDSVLSMDLPTEIANAIIDGYIPSNNISVTDYLLGSNLAYRYGYAGAKDIELMLDSDVRNIPEHLSKGLYNLGKETAKAEISKEQAEIDSKKTQKSENKAKKKGKVTFDSKELSKEFEDSLTDIQRESIKGIKVIAEVLGNDVNLFASYIAKEGPYKGKRVYKDLNGNVKLAPNGFYNPDGSINLDINSGNLGEGTMLYTLSHELTHHIRKWSPAKFKVLADFVVEQYSDNGIKINDLVYEQLAKAKKNGKSISYGTAYEEVIADACSTMLLDSDAIEKLAQKDKTLFEKIKSFIKDFIDKINKLYKNFSPDAKEAQYVKAIKGMTDKLQALWFEGLEDAGETYGKIEAESLNHTELKYELRKDESGKTFVSVDENAMDLNNGRSIAENINLILKKFNNIIDVKGQKIRINKTTNGEWRVGSAARKLLETDRQAYNDKIKAIANADDILKAANKWVGEKVKHTRKDDIVEFARGNVRYKVANNGYIADVLVAIKKDGSAVLYELVDIVPTKITEPSSYQGKKSPRRHDSSVTKETIPQDSESSQGKFSLRESVEETKDLVAVHNISEEKLLKSLQLGGLPMPSIAIIRAKEGHENFGTISLVFGKKTIDPQFFRSNKVYSGDAWTPTYPRVEYKIDENVVEKGVDEVERLIKSRGFGKDDFGYLSSISEDSFKYGNTEEVANKTALQVAYLIDKGIDFKPVYNGSQTKINEWETKNEIADLIDKTDYKKWVNNLFDGFVAKEGIRNNKDLFTPSGNRRSFEALHYEHNLENVIKAMKEEGTKGVGAFGGGNIFGASTTEISSIADIKNSAEKRFRSLSEEEFSEIKKGFADRFFELASSLPNNKDSFTATDDAANVLVEAISKYKTKSGIANYIRRECQGWATYSDYVVDDLIELVSDIQQMPTKYFEAKPQRAVGFDEVKAVVIPDNSSAELKSALKSFNVLEYQSGNEQDRAAVLNSIEDVKFSDRDSDGNTLSKEQQEFFKDSKVRDKNGNLLVVYHGTRKADFTVFKRNINFFTDDKEMADSYAYNSEMYTGYLNIVNPYIIDAKGEKWSRIPIDTETKNMLAEYGASTFKEGGKWRTTPADIASAILDGIDNGDFDYDGIIVRNINDTGSYYKSNDNIIADDYITFNSNQFKNADNKAPTSDTDIRFSDRSFSEQIDDVLDGADTTSTHLKVMDTPSILQEAGLPDLPILMTAKHLKSITASSGKEKVNYHGLDVDIVKKLPKYISEPVMIADSLTRDDSIVVITEAVDSKKRPVLAAILLDGAGRLDSKHINANIMTSAYGKDNFNSFLKRIADNDALVYWNKKKSQALSVSLGLQLPNAITSLNSDTIIRKAKAFDKKKIGSQQKNLSDTDTRYSERDPDSFAARQEVQKQLVKENAILKEDNILLKELVALQRKVTNGTILKKSSVDAVSKKIMKQLNVKGNTQELSKLLSDVYSYILRGTEVTWEDITEKAQPAINWIYENMQTEKVVDEYTLGVLREIRKSRVSLDETQKAEINAVLGSYKDFQRYTLGKIIIAKDGLSMDSWWGEMNEKYPNIFDSDISSNDMPTALIGILDNLSNSLYEEVYNYQSEMTKQDVLTEIYDGYWDVSTLHTVADQNQKKINELKAKHKEKLSKVRSSHNKKIIELKNKHKQEIKEIKTALREKALQKEQDIRTKYQESRQKSIEGREKTAMRHKIKKVVSELNNLLLHGSKEKNVKLGLQKAVASALKTINMDTVNADERVAKYDELIAKASDPVVIDSLTESRDRIKKQGDVLSDKLDALRKAYDDIINSKKGDIDFPDYYKTEAALVKQKIESVSDLVGDTPIRNMSLEQLNAVYDMYRMVLTTIRNVNKLWRNNKLEDLRTRADAVMSQVSKLPALKEERGKKIGKVQEYIWNELIPVYAFETVGSEAFTELFWDSVEGMNTWAKDIEESLDFAEKTRKKYNLSSWDRNEVHSIKLESGKTMRLTLEHMMSIYAYSKRKQAEKHMTLGGFFFDSNETFTVKKGVHEVSKSSEASYKISLNDMQTITAKMNEVAKGSLGYVDEMQAYLTKMGEKGNEVSRVLWGIDIFTEKVYFPLKSKKDFTVQPNNPVQASSLKNDGMTKETVPNASNPIVLQKFDDVWSNHVNRMSQYHGFVLPIENLNKVFGYGKWLDGEAKAVSTVIESRHGAAATEYISKFIDDLNGNVLRDSVKNPLASFFTNVKKTTVAMSGSTVAQQPTAIIRAMALVNPKYFVHRPHRQDFRFLKKYELIKKHAPVAFVKEMGGFEAGSGRRVQDVINESLKIGWDKAKQKIDDITMFGAEMGDVIGWCAIWDAVEREVQSQHKNVDVGSQEYFKLVGDRFTKVIVYTQVFDSTLSRSGFMRSNSEIMKMLTAYGGEPTVSVNMMYSAILKAKRGGSKWQSARTLGVVYASTIVAAAAASVYYALRDDDDDETFGEKFAEAWADKLFGGTYGLTGELNPLTQLPAIKDIISIFDGWDVERMDVAIFKDLKNAIDSLNSDNKSDWRKIEDFTGAIGAMFGIPVKNILRSGREIYNAFKMGYNSFFGDVESDGFWNAFGRGFSGEKKPKEKEKAKRNTTKYNNSDILEALEEGSLTTAAEMIEDLIAERTANYIEEDEELSEKKATKKAQASVRSAVTQHLKPLYIEAYQSKDQSKMRELRYLMRDLKIYGSVSDILSTCNNWVKESRKK